MRGLIAVLVIAHGTQAFTVRKLKRRYDFRYGSQADLRRTVGPRPLYPRKRTCAARPRYVRFVPIPEM